MCTHHGGMRSDDSIDYACLSLPPQRASVQARLGLAHWGPLSGFVGRALMRLRDGGRYSRFARLGRGAATLWGWQARQSDKPPAPL